MNDLVSRKAAIDALWKALYEYEDETEQKFQASDELSIDDWFMHRIFVQNMSDIDRQTILNLPSAQPEGYIKIPETGIDDLSDGFHTFRQLYYQRMMLFLTIVKQNKERSWKSLRHEDGELCFGGGWFIVGIDTPEGSYTYHYEDNFFSLFDCVELERAKHWDGHTEKDVTRLLSLPSAEPNPFCALADRSCPFQGKEFVWCLTCPHISEEDRTLVKKAVEPNMYRFLPQLWSGHERRT